MLQKANFAALSSKSWIQFLLNFIMSITLNKMQQKHQNSAENNISENTIKCSVGVLNSWVSALFFCFVKLCVSKCVSLFLCFGLVVRPHGSVVVRTVAS